MAQLELKKKLLNVLALAGLIVATVPVSKIVFNTDESIVSAQTAGDEAVPDDDDIPDAAQAQAVTNVRKALAEIKEAIEGMRAEGGSEEHIKDQIKAFVESLKNDLAPLVRNRIKDQDVARELREAYNKILVEVLGEQPLPDPNPGTGPKVEIKEEEETFDIDFGTATVLDNNMDKGTEREESPGKKGTLTIIYTVEYHDGVRQANTRREKTRNRTVEPVDRVVHVGNRDVVTFKEEVETEAEPFQTITQDDDTIERGKEEVKVEGENGVRTKTYRVKFINGERQESEREMIKNEVTQIPVDRVVARGTKPIITTDTVVETSEIPYGTQTQPNPNLARGVRNTLREGVKGKSLKTYTVTYTDGVQTGKDLTNEELTPAVDEIVEIGTREETVQPESTRQTSTRTEAIPFEVIDKDSRELDADQTSTEVEGQDGVRTITEEWYADKDGVEIPGTRREIGNEVTQQPVSRVVAHGTRPVKHSEVVNEAIPFTTIQRDNAALPLGQTRIEFQGKNGIATVTYEWLVDRAGNVVPGSRQEVSRTVTLEPVTQVELAGTMPAGSSSESSSESSNGANTSRSSEGPTVNSGSDKQVVNKDGKKLPETGETQNYGFVMGALLFIASTLVTVFRRKHN